jgi:hypothetical protein
MALVALSVAGGCKKDPPVAPYNPPTNNLTGVNKWIHEELVKWYYWNDVVAATAAPDNGLAYDEFLTKTIESLPWASVQDRSSGENPATIDGVWDENHTKREYIYTNITREPAVRSVAASESRETTFGFDFVVFVLVDQSGRPTGNYLFLVTWVREGSDAWEQGLRRGSWIVKHNGKTLDYSQYVAFWNQMYLLLGGNTMKISIDTNGDQREDKVLDLTAREMTVSPILEHKMITSGGGKKVAYLLYNQFLRGDDNEFDDELREVFGEFKAAGAEELVLDMRYNPGGYVSSCQILSSLVANVTTSDIFAQMLRNKKIQEAYPGISNPEVVSFRNEPNGLKLNKIYVLATRSSASASEMVINAVRGVLGDGDGKGGNTGTGGAVVHIGEQTNGKNVGMDILEKTIDGYAYRLSPISFKILNKQGFTNYADGFTPQYQLDEFGEMTNTVPLYELGDPRERLLKAALTLIDGGKVTPDTRSTRTVGNGPLQRIDHPANPRQIGGAINIPDLGQ